MVDILTTDASRTYVHIRGWQNDRELMFDSSFAYLELSLARCQHCATCSSRIAHVERALIGKPHDMIHADRRLFVQLPLPADLPRTMSAVGTYVADQLSLAISSSW